ncbi:MAG: acylphosphatase [Deltaproteobacteria bacterium]|nr:acylphosphatase [Deltaproteobacteria bacterium]
MSQELKRLHLIVSGRVQGVAFRAYTQGEARSLKLTGWVRNLPTGQVEILAEGPLQGLEKFLQWASHGPPSAQVRHVETTWGPSLGEFSEFSITY